MDILLVVKGHTMGAQSMGASKSIASPVGYCCIRMICFRIVAVDAIDTPGAYVLPIGLCIFAIQSLSHRLIARCPFPLKTQPLLRSLITCVFHCRIYIIFRS